MFNVNSNHYGSVAMVIEQSRGGALTSHSQFNAIKLDCMIYCYEYEIVLRLALWVIWFVCVAIEIATFSAAAKVRVLLLFLLLLLLLLLLCVCVCVLLLLLFAQHITWQPTHTYEYNRTDDSPFLFCKYNMWGNRWGIKLGTGLILGRS